MTETQLCLKKTPGIPRKVSRFWAGEVTQRDLNAIREAYTEIIQGRTVSLSLIVRRSLGLLATHLREVQGQADQTEIDYETAVLMRHMNN